jgi:purine nucleosidase
MIDPTVFTTENADIRDEVAGRWTKGMTVCNFEKTGGMLNFGGTASEQVDFRHTVAMKLDHPKFWPVVDAGDAAEIPKWDPEGDRVHLQELSH